MSSKRKKWTSYFGYDILDSVSFPFLVSAPCQAQNSLFCWDECQSPKSCMYSLWDHTWIEYLHWWKPCICVLSCVCHWSLFPVVLLSRNAVWCDKSQSLLCAVIKDPIIYFLKPKPYILLYGISYIPFFHNTFLVGIVEIGWTEVERKEDKVIFDPSSSSERLKGYSPGNVEVICYLVLWVCC